MKSLWYLIATFFHVGHLPIAPGSWASLITTGVLYLVGITLNPHPLWLILSTIPIFLIGIPASTHTEARLGNKDPRPVVIDEVLGQMISLWWVPVAPPAFLASFILFRIFDITKPFPANWADRNMPGGLGIMVDDLFAGLYALGGVHLLIHFNLIPI